MELAPRDMVSRAIYLEIRDGRGAGPKKDYVYLDVRHLGRAVIEEKLPDITDFARVYLGVEPLTEPVPIQPTAHYAMGGIPTDLRARVMRDEANTVVDGLFAAGEAACVSVHGANRLGHELARGPARVRTSRRPRDGRLLPNRGGPVDCGRRRRSRFTPSWRHSGVGRKARARPRSGPSSPRS